MTTLRTPNEMYDKAKELMLENREPATRDDWLSVIDFWACNVVPEFAVPVIKLMCLLFNCPLSDELIEETVNKTLFNIMLTDLLKAIDR